MKRPFVLASLALAIAATGAEASLITLGPYVVSEESAEIRFGGHVVVLLRGMDPLVNSEVSIPLDTREGSWNVVCSGTCEVGWTLPNWTELGDSQHFTEETITLFGEERGVRHRHTSVIFTWHEPFTLPQPMGPAGRVTTFSTPFTMEGAYRFYLTRPGTHLLDSVLVETTGSGTAFFDFAPLPRHRFPRGLWEQTQDGDDWLPVRLQFDSVPPASIPEPTTTGLILVGLAAGTWRVARSRHP